MNLLMTLDRNYVPQLNVMLFSALHSDSAAHLTCTCCTTRDCRRRIWWERGYCWGSGANCT